MSRPNGDDEDSVNDAVCCNVARHCVKNSLVTKDGGPTD